MPLSWGMGRGFQGRMGMIGRGSNSGAASGCVNWDINPLLDTSSSAESWRRQFIPGAHRLGHVALDVCVRRVVIAR